MKTISIGDVEYIAFRIAQELLTLEEPIPQFESRYPNILESCLATPFQRFPKKSLYPGLIKKASILFYLMIKNHSFHNGNKRIAMTTLLVFLYINGKWIDADLQEVHNLTAWIAESPAQFMEEAVSSIEKFLTTHVTDAQS